jgi:hypothetical protein
MRPQVLALGLLVLVGSVSSAPTAVASTVTPSAANLHASSTTAATSVPNDSLLVGSAQSAVGVLASPDYPIAGWAPAAATNFTVSDRPVSYQVNMIVIHSTESSYSAAKAAFQDPTRLASAHYLISRTGRIAQMVLEQDIAWHAGNWDYNTRAIGIEHEGYAGVPGSFTLVEYRTSAHLAASICSRWGVPMDRKHVIGHYEVPDPNNPALGGGLEHHWDPGPYWDWNYFMYKAKEYANYLPSLPHMGPDPTAVSREGGITLSWQPAQSCTTPITGYTVIGQPGNIALTLPATTTSVWIPELQDGVAYSFTVTANNVQGHSSLTSNTAVVGPPCTSASLTAAPSAPVPTGTAIDFTASSTACNSPEYAFMVKAPGGRWSVPYSYGGATWTWNTTGRAPGIYQVQVWARQKGSGNAADAYAITTYTLGVGGCQNAGLAPLAPSPQVPGTQVTFQASSTGCLSPQYQFWLMPPGGTWISVQAYSPNSQWVLDSSKYPSGNFQVSVWVRQAGSASLHESYFGLSYWIHAAGGCVVTALDPSVASPQIAGASVTFTAQSNGCTANQYKFWLKPPGGSWGVVQPYGAVPTWTWNTATYGSGFYQVIVWEGSSTTPNAFESSAMVSFVLTAAGCRSASLSSSVAPPQRPGTSISFTATSTGCGSPEYLFRVMPPGGTYAVMQPYGGDTWSWDTSGLAPGTYQVAVWARQAGSSAAFEAYDFTAYQLTVLQCASATITAGPASPQAAGTLITFTATTSGCTSAQYEFWVQLPGGAWKLLRAYSTSTTSSWTSTGVGAHRFAVWTVANGSINLYDSYALTDFVVS